MRPLALLPPPQAAFLFTIVSLVALVLAVALLLGSIPRLTLWFALLAGAAAGLFPPVIGSLYFGQANLIVLFLLALAYRFVMPGPMLGISGAIKLYPVSGLLAALLQKRWRALNYGLLTLLILLLFQLFALGGGATAANSFLAPDTYWTNESINGWLSRLAITSTWTRAPYPGLPIEPLMLAIAGALVVLTVIVIRRAPYRSWEGALAISLWLGVVAAPKNSLWNFTPLLLGILYAWVQLDRRWWLFGIGAVGWLLLEAQAQLDSSRATVYQASPALAWLSSVGLYGALILGFVIAYVVLRPASGNRPSHRDADRELDIRR